MPTPPQPASQPPTQELSKQYRPADHEARIFAKWQGAGAFHADPGRVLRGEAEPYCVLIPPPNVTDRLHLGHALNNTLQDILVRAHRMMGFEALWMPGTDHAGIATQAVVERRLKKEGILKGPLRQSMQRDEFVAHVQAFKDEYEAVITGQLKAMGCSCDWERQRFTMDPVCARAVREAFFRLFRDGLIYRGKRLVNWDPALQTAVSDDEVENIEVDGHFYYLRYPLVHRGESSKAAEQQSSKSEKAGTPVNQHVGPSEESDAVPVTWDELARRGYAGAGGHDPEGEAYVTVATTRPETYLGDTAVAVNPHDPRAKALRGLSVELPIVGRVIPIIEDDYVVLPAREGAYGKDLRLLENDEPEDAKAAFATGFLKVTPAHDPNDYELGRRHKLAVINVMAPDASLSDKHGWTDVGDAHIFVGKKREEARKLVVKEFEARGLLEDSKPYRHSVGHSDRSKAAIEPYLSDQWYVRVTDPRMAGAANAALTPEQRTHAQAETGAAQAGAEPASVRPDRTTVRTSRTEAGTDAASVRAVRTTVPTSRTTVRTVRTESQWNGAAAGAGDGALAFHPARYSRTYETWHDNIRDWCISRQLWWGHRIPVWHRRLSAAEWGAQKRPGRSEADSARMSDTSFAVITPVGHWEPMLWDQDTLVHWKPEAGVEVDCFICLGPGETVLEARALEAAGFIQDPDVLDTWFSSALWPMSTMGWPDADAAAQETGIADFPSLLPAFNPTSTLCTAREIITLWVSRMVMFNRYFLPLHEGGGGGVGSLTPVAHEGHGSSARAGRAEGGVTGAPTNLTPGPLTRGGGGGPVPFRDVYIHCVVQDGQGRKMSKSLGNGVDPLDIIASHGTDAMRFTICQMATQTQDVRLPVKKDPATGRNTSDKFDQGRNFANKVWNAASFALRNLNLTTETQRHREEQGKAELSLPDRWMLSRLAAAVGEVEGALANFEFSGYAQIVYDLLWRDFCDWYLEAIKPTVATDPGQRAVLLASLDTILRLLHPIMPYVTEAIYGQVRGISAGAVAGVTLGGARKGDVLATAAWPRLDGALRDERAEVEFEQLRALITAVREVRAKHNVHPKRRVTLHAPASEIGHLRANQTLVVTLAGLGAVTDQAPAGRAVEFTCDGAEYRLSDLADEAGGEGVDAGAEKARLTKLIADLEKSVTTFEGRLANPGYALKAPPAMVQQTKDQMEKARAELVAARKALEALGS